MSQIRGTGRVGVVVETAPGHFVSMRVHGTLFDIIVDHERDVTPFGPEGRERGMSTVRIVIEGYLAGEEQTAPPEWASEPVEITAPPRELEG